MTTNTLAELKQKHDEFISKAKIKGANILIFRTPCCNNDTEGRAAPIGDVWDTLATCVHCGATYMKITTAKIITAELIDLT